MPCNAIYDLVIRKPFNFGCFSYVRFVFPNYRIFVCHDVYPNIEISLLARLIRFPEPARIDMLFKRNNDSAIKPNEKIVSIVFIMQLFLYRSVP